MKVVFTHGSRKAFESFKYFNVHHRYDEMVLDLLTGDQLGGNGIDLSGMGVYGAEGINADAVDYYSGDDGFVYFCSIKIDDFANEMPADTIDPSMWMEVCAQSIKNIDLLHGFDEEDMRSRAEDLEFGDEDGLAKFLDSIAHTSIDTYDLHSFENFEDIDEWMCALEEQIEISAPSSSAREEMAYMDLDEFTTRHENSLWDVVNKINKCMMYNAEGKKFFNECFYRAYKEIIGSHPSLIAARTKVGDQNVIIAFDLDDIKIDRIVDLSLRKEKTTELNGLNLR